MNNQNFHTDRPVKEKYVDDDTQENMQLVNKRRDFEERKDLKSMGVSDVRVSSEVKQGLRRN